MENWTSIYFFDQAQLNTLGPWQFIIKSVYFQVKIYLMKLSIVGLFDTLYTTWLTKNLFELPVLSAFIFFLKDWDFWTGGPFQSSIN